MSKCEHERQRQTCSVCSPDQVFVQYQRKAAQRGLSFTLSLDEFKRIVQDKCCYCGEWGEPRGIDRRDNRVGYVPSNCQSCCKGCNFLKQGMTHYEFLNLVSKIARYQITQRTKGIQHEAATGNIGKDTQSPAEGHA